jgi:inner membrane protein
LPPAQLSLPKSVRHRFAPWGPRGPRVTRADARLAVGLFAFALGLDGLWALIGSDTGSLTYGIADIPAHLAACALVLVWLRAFAGRQLSPPFAMAALVTSVAIEIDHVPGYLGSHVLTGRLPRPYSHSMLLVLAPAAVGWAFRRRELGALWGGIGCGVAAHLLRDLTTGPGAPLFWPISNTVVRLPYAVFAALLAAAALSVVVAPRILRVRDQLDARDHIGNGWARSARQKRPKLGVSRPRVGSHRR